MIVEAAQFAAKAHANQFRKYTNAPYIEHPMRVAGRVTLIPEVTEQVIAAAWLHDVVEDCGVSSDEIATKFSVEVRDLVIELTNPSKGSTLTRRERKDMDREHLSKVSRWAKIIKAIDRLDNLKDMRRAEAGFRRLYANESKLLCNVLRVSNDPVLSSLIDLVLSEAQVISQ